MINSDGKNFYSPSMLKKYLSCKHIIFNEKYEKDLKLKRQPNTIVDEIMFDKGNIHEKQYFEKLKKKFSKVKDIKNLKNVDKFKETLKAMQQGFEVIYGGWLTDGKWRGESDFLEINFKRHSNFGNYSYTVIDTKNSNKIKGDHIYQVGVYCDLLKKIQGVFPEKFYILLKNNKKEEVKLNDVFEVFHSQKNDYENFLKKEVNETVPEKCNFCNFCDWSKVCEQNWIKNRHLNQIGGINKLNIKKFNKNGVNTIDDLVKIKPGTKLKGLRDEIITKRIEQAKLQLQYEKDNKPIFKNIEENLYIRKGFNILPKPSEGDIFFDLESSQHAYDEKIEYLFGIFYIEDKKEKFVPLWAHNKNEEKKNVIEFFDFTKNHFKKFPNAKIYHYANYEINALERLTSIYKVKSIEYDNYLRNGKFVDLFRVVKQSIIVSENSYSIKNLEKFYNFKRKGDVQKGEKSEEFYIEWTKNKKSKLLDEIEFYNQQDCKSTYELRQWLIQIKPKDTKWFENEIDGEIDEIKPHEELMIENINKINSSNIKNKNLKQIISDVIGFYTREDKPSWREFFDRKDLSNEELMEDREVIANMKLLSYNRDPSPRRRSTIYKYIYPDQEFKLKKGKQVSIANNVEIDRSDAAGKIEELDPIQRIVTLRKGISKSEGILPKILSIGEKPPKASRYSNLNSNIYNYCNDVVDNQNNFKAITSILIRDYPNVIGVKKGEKLINSDNFEREIPKTLLNLKESYLFCQGPPGSGKTFHAANAIIELIKQNKKIAITANSHKVIHNLLERIEKIAQNKNCLFKGLKKGNKDDKETYFDGKFVSTGTDDRPFLKGLDDKSISLFAGTKFHLSNAYYRSKIDYLFIDEAGQMTITDVIAIGVIAKNIILIGDQQQLGQPTRGSHPNDSGKSILDFLLENRDTIDETKGIFLNKTYRLHPTINNYISNSFYDGRLLTNHNSENRKIKYPETCLIKNDGIHFLAMRHKDNSQKSEDELKIIKLLMDQLIGSIFIDNKAKRKLTIEDILIVTPYNVQVNYLLENLKKGSRVGTVDKFQGQEAPVTIVSMVSSDTDSLPRNKSWFFNRNRLNVALSRSQCSSIILFNPDLLKTAPSDLEEIKLLNNFHKLLKFRVN